MAEAIQPSGLLISAIVATAVIIATIRATRAPSFLHPSGIVLIGGGLTWLMCSFLFLALGPQYAFRFLDLTKSPTERLYWWVVTGIFWLLLFYVLRTVRLKSWGRRIVAVIAVQYGWAGFIWAASVIAERLFAIHSPFSWLQSIATPREQLPIAFLPALITMLAVQIWLLSVWVRRSSGHFLFAENVRAIALKGMVMSKLTDQSTRLLCASVLLGHGGAREKLLRWLKDENRSVALEVGLDLRLAAQVARFAERRYRRGWWTYFGIFCATAFLSLAVPPAWILGGVAAAIFWARRYIEERRRFAPLFFRESFRPEQVAQHFPASLQQRELDSLPSLDQNFFVYGGFSPFVGAGNNLGGWSVAVALDKAKEGFGSNCAIQPFEIGDVYTALDTGLDSLQVNGIQKKDCFFANGSDLRGNPALLPDIYGRPVQHLNDGVAVRYIYADDEKVRYYRCYRVLDWGGELALSYYVRCTRRGNTLFVETERFVLPPLASSYRTVDQMGQMKWKELTSAMAASLVVGPVFAAISPAWAAFDASRVLKEAITPEGSERRHLIDTNPAFNYGTLTSLRHDLSGGVYGHYFQKMDGDLYIKLFEREVLDSLVEFLDAHGIDTSDLKERQTTILNTGVMVQGGDVKAESLAVGAGSRAVKNVQSALASGKGTGE